MDKTFSFSICMPVYQGSHLIGNAIDSIRKQGFENYEMLIGDDNQAEAKAESDKTKEILDSYNDPRIKYTKNEKNLGYPENLKSIVSRVTKDIIFLLPNNLAQKYINWDRKGAHKEITELKKLKGNTSFIWMPICAFPQK